MEFTKNIDEDVFGVLVQQLQKGECMRLSPRPKRVGPRVEGISLTLEEFKKAKAERLEVLVRKEEKRQAKLMEIET